MKIAFLRTIVGWILIGGHVLCGLVILFYLPRYLGEKNIIEVLSVILPVTTAYVISVIKEFIDNQNELKNEAMVSLNFSLLSIFSSIVIITFNLYLLFSYPGDMVPDVPALQKWIAWSQTALGATFGLALKDLFKGK